MDGKRLKGGTVEVRDWDGGVHEATLKPLTTIYAKGLGYGHPDFRHIEYKDGVAQAETHDTTDGGDPSRACSTTIPATSTRSRSSTSARSPSGEQTSYGVVRLSI